VGPRAIDEREWTLHKAKSLVKLLALALRHRLHREHIIDRYEDWCTANHACGAAPSAQVRRLRHILTIL
jgi:hypothetical protein